MVHAVDVPAVTIEVAYCAARRIAAYNSVIVVAYVAIVVAYVVIVVVVVVVNAEVFADKGSAACSKAVESAPRTIPPAWNYPCERMVNLMPNCLVVSQLAVHCKLHRWPRVI